MPTLHWIGKDKVMNHHRAVPFRVLEHGYGFTNGNLGSAETQSGNKVIHGDNLEALKALLPEYEGKIKCIYIDPPYNTGKEEWLYTDKVNHPQIEKWFYKTIGKEGEDLARDDKWLCMMYPRIKLLHKLLKEDGVFFCSIDDYEHSNLKLILDEIFGISNFINNIIWQRAFSPINTKKRFSPNHDFILCYAKNIQLVQFTLPRTEEADKRYSNPDNDNRGDWTSSDLTVGPVVKEKLYEIKTPNGKRYLPPSGRCWVVTEDRFNELRNDNRIWFGEDGSNMPRFKRFKSDVKDGMTPLTVWTYKEVGHTQEAKKEIKELFPESDLPFDTPKPVKLMERILQLSTENDSLILDSFSGSGTTAHAVLNLNKQDGGNRKFILIEMEEYAETITAERVKRVINGYSDKEGTGGSFDYYTLGQPLFTGDNQEYLNEHVEIEKIKQYIWYSETRTAYQAQDNKHNTYYLGQKEETAYYFIYEKDRLTTLDFDMLGIIESKAGQYILYADNCLLPKEFMLENNISFKKIPRDITRF